MYGLWISSNDISIVFEIFFETTAGILISKSATLTLNLPFKEMVFLLLFNMNYGAYFFIDISNC